MDGGVELGAPLPQGGHDELDPACPGQVPVDDLAETGRRGRHGALPFVVAQRAVTRVPGHARDHRAGDFAAVAQALHRLGRTLAEGPLEAVEVDVDVTDGVALHGTGGVRRDGHGRAAFVRGDGGLAANVRGLVEHCGSLSLGPGPTVWRPVLWTSFPAGPTARCSTRPGPTFHRWDAPQIDGYAAPPRREDNAMRGSFSPICLGGKGLSRAPRVIPPQGSGAREGPRRR